MLALAFLEQFVLPVHDSVFDPEHGLEMKVGIESALFDSLVVEIARAFGTDFAD